jgi:hypothetical protein
MVISKNLGQLRVRRPEQAATPATVTPIEPTPSSLTSNAKKRKAAIEIADEKAARFAAIRQKLQKLDTRIKSLLETAYMSYNNTKLSAKSGIPVAALLASMKHTIFAISIPCP